MANHEKRQERIQRLFENHNIISATIESKERMGFITHAWGEEYETPEEREILLILYDANALPPKQSGFMANIFTGVRRGIPILSQDGKNSILGLFTQGSYKGVIHEFVNNMKDYKTIRTEISSAHYSMWAGATIGSAIYFAGTPRKLFKRHAPGKWKDLTSRENHPQMFADVEVAEAEKDEDGFVEIELGFNAVDGFAEDDIYAGGEQGDCWHYDGENWRALDLPSNTDIESICCAPDGQVYIGASQGTLIKGRLDAATGEHWEIIPFAESPSEEDFRSMAWFKDQLWLAGWQGTYRLEIEKGQPIVKPYAFPAGGAQQISFNGGVCSCDEALMVWGESQVMLYDGEQWEDFLISAIPLDIPEEVEELLEGE